MDKQPGKAGEGPAKRLPLFERLSAALKEARAFVRGEVELTRRRVTPEDSAPDAGPVQSQAEAENPPSEGVSW